MSKWCARAMGIFYFFSAAALGGDMSGDKFRQFEGEDWPTPNDYRSATGAPGFRYWQQQVTYEIAARLDEPAKTLTGRAHIRYHNRSPDELTYLWLLLDQNDFKPHSHSALTRTGSADTLSATSLRRLQQGPPWEGGFTIKSVRDSAGRSLRYSIVDTLMRIEMPKPIAANSGEFRFTIEWSLPIIDGKVGGFGGYECFDDGNCIFQISQWFPRLAAYSDYEGWHNKTFLAAGGGEFTLEFGDYRVALTVPADHIVAATGELQNAAAVLTAGQGERLRRAKSAAEPVYIVTLEEAESAEKQRSSREKTWIFSAKRVRDFAWAASRKFVWDAMGVRQDSSEQPLVMAMSFYAKEGHPLWDRYSTQAIAHGLKVSVDFTFAYPYPTVQSVDGAAPGMEYPMISFNGLRAGKDPERRQIALLGVVFHEVAHNFFPMIVNTDERQWTWMDEGLVAFLQYQSEQRWDANYPSGRGQPKDITRYMTSSDQVPVMTQADSLLQASQNSYAKPATALNILRETILGRESFDRALREFAKRWQFKRPTPYDFFRCMEESSGVDLDWFWRGWFYSTDHVDIALQRVESVQVERDGTPVPGFAYRFTFQNMGGVVMPVILKFDFVDGTSETVRIPAEIWRKNAELVTWEFVGAQELQRAELDPLLETADADRGNNVQARPFERRTFKVHSP